MWSGNFWIIMFLVVTILFGILGLIFYFVVRNKDTTVQLPFYILMISFMIILYTAIIVFNLKDITTYLTQISCKKPVITNHHYVIQQKDEVKKEPVKVCEEKCVGNPEINNLDRIITW